MKRLLVVSMLSLALAGCAQSKGALSRGASYPPSPVATTPVPSIYDTINTGVGGTALAQTAIKNPDDPQWAGRIQVSEAARPISPGAPGAQTTVATAPAAGPAATTASTNVPAAVPGMQQTPGLTAGASPAPMAPAGAPAAMPAIANQSSAPPAVAQSLPATGAPGPYAPSDSRFAASGAPMDVPANIPAAAAPAAMSQAAAPPPYSAVNPPDAVGPMVRVSTPARAAAAPRRNADPLLGPDPDLMPAMPELPPVKASAKPAPAPSAASSPAPASAPSTSDPSTLELAPAGSPASSPMPEPNSAAPPAANPVTPGPLVPAEPPVNLDPSTAASKPADGGLAAADPPLEHVPEPGPARSPSSAPASGRRDSQVVLTSRQAPGEPPSKRLASAKESGRAVARVGDEVITRTELESAINEEVFNRPGFLEQLRNSEEPMRSEVLDGLKRRTLENLIDRSLIVQEAKRHLKDKKVMDQIYQEADKIFNEYEFNALKRKYNVDSEAKLKERLAEDGRSLEAMRISSRETFIARNFVMAKIRDRVKVELPDLLKYYNDRVYLHDFDRPSQITWREIVVEVNKHKTRDEAQQKATGLLEKVRRGADFATLARDESEGPASSRREGGLMRTSPGSYALKPMNEALDSLPLGQVSELIEGPESFHIVKVENRRPAGPASFEEVQDRIRPLLEQKKWEDEHEAFIKKIKKNAIVSNLLPKIDPTKP